MVNPVFALGAWARDRGAVRADAVEAALAELDQVALRESFGPDRWRRRGHLLKDRRAAPRDIRTFPVQHGGSSRMLCNPPSPNLRPWQVTPAPRQSSGTSA